MAVLARLALNKILRRRVRKLKSELSYHRRRVQAYTPAPPAHLCDIYLLDALSFLSNEELIGCRQVSSDLNQKICAWQLRKRLSSRMTVDLRFCTVSALPLRFGALLKALPQFRTISTMG